MLEDHSDILKTIEVLVHAAEIVSQEIIGRHEESLPIIETQIIRYVKML